MSASASDSTFDVAVATARQCAEWDPNEETRGATVELLKVVDAGDASDAAKAEVVTRFGSRLAFGTAGLRGPMGHGTSCMNDLTCVQASQGLAAYALAQFGDAAKERGIAIGYDHRKAGACNSEQFALLSAAAIMSKGMRVYLYDRLVATPLVPYAVDAKGCVAGIMVTASHNPKADNGYKVYWANGSQIIPPHDDGIADSIHANLAPWATYDVSTVRANSLCINCTDELIDGYLDMAVSKLCRHRETNGTSAVKIAYTAMHGVGHPFCVRIFEGFGLSPFFSTPEQEAADPDFPTVAFPNPEEGKGALELAMRHADSNDASIILANDPDADRLAVAERDDAGAWTVFSGNEIGAMLGHWQWEEYKAANPGTDGSEVVMLASTVSSKMLGAVARKNGFAFEETLTGFKWLGNRAFDLRRLESKHVLFSYEQAIGFCVGDVVKDKDGVVAAAVCAEMANQLAARGQTLKQYFRSLQEDYGYFVANDGYVFSYEKEVTARIFARLRNDGHYWLNCGPYRIEHVRDLTTGVDTSTGDLKPTLPVDTSTHMITFTFANGCVCTLRTSGTEPKLKYYTEMAGEDPEATAKVLEDMVYHVVEEMLQPELNGLTRRKEG